MIDVLMLLPTLLIINMREPKAFGEYADMELIPCFISMLSRLDIVWGQYVSNSLKKHAHYVWGEDTRRRVLDGTVTPKNWAGFLQNSENKRELFYFLAEKLSKVDPGAKEIYTTYLENALPVNVHDNCTNKIIPCNHEEADTCMLNGYQKVSIRTVNTDVVVLSVAHIQHLQISELWIEFAVGKHYCFIPAHLIAPKCFAILSCTYRVQYNISFLWNWKENSWEVFPKVTTV